MLHFYDRETLLAALSLPLDAELHQLLQQRIDHFAKEGLFDLSEIVVIDAETTEAQLIEAIDFTPLTDLDGRRFGDPGFCSRLEYVAKVSPSYHEAIIIVGNSGFAFHLLIQDDAEPELVEVCGRAAASEDWSAAALGSGNSP